MQFEEHLRLALSSLKVNRLRSALALLGIVIGTSSVIAMISIGEGARNQVQGELTGLGSSMIFIQPDYLDRDVTLGRVPYLSLEDVGRIKALAPHVLCASPQIPGHGTIRWGRKEKAVGVIATNDEFAWVQGLSMEAGRFFSTSDLSGRRRVAVLGRDLAERLFGTTSPVGKRVRINGERFTVVGVMGPLARAPFGAPDGDLDSSVYIPATTARRLLGTDKVPLMVMTARDLKSVDVAMEEVEVLLERSYGERHGFRVESAKSLLESAGAILTLLTAVLGSIGGISLLVGGIGIMNIMLVTVRERTREIGIRKALGARREDILVQFIIEAIMLCLTGGVGGIILGGLGAGLIALLSPIPASVSWVSITLSFLSSLLVGISSGVYPALQAARLDPVQALRYE